MWYEIVGCIIFVSNVLCVWHSFYDKGRFIQHIKKLTIKFLMGINILTLQTFIFVCQLWLLQL